MTTAQDDQPDEAAGLLIRSNLPMGTLTQELKNALALGKTAGAMLFGLKPYDPLTISLSALALTVVAILASYVPARRAAQLDPMAALRDE